MLEKRYLTVDRINRIKGIKKITTKGTKIHEGINNSIIRTHI